MSLAWRTLVQVQLVVACLGPYEVPFNRAVAGFAAILFWGFSRGHRLHLSIAVLVGVVAAGRMGFVAPALVGAAGPHPIAVEIVERVSTEKAVAWVGGYAQAPRRVWLSLPAGFPRATRRALARAGFSPVVSQRNPDDRDGRRALLARGVRGRAYVTRQDYLPLPSRSGGVGVRQRLAQRWRERWGAQSALWIALFLGDREALGRGPQQLFARLGMAHLLALSGLHVGIVAALLLWPFRRWGRRALLAVLPVIAAWALVAGLSSSLFRSVAMLAWWSIGHRLGRPARAIDGVAVVALAEILWRPWVLLGLGWWLSYVATAAILRASDPLRRLPRWLGALGVSGVAQLSTLPWVLGAFGQLAWLSAVLLLFIGPVFALVLGIGLVVLVLDGLFAWPGAEILLAASSHLLGALLAVAARWTPEPWGHPGISGPFWAAAMAILALLLPPWRGGVRARILLALSILFGAHWGVLHPPRASWVSLDVGQGDAGVYRSRSHTLVVDAGPWSRRYDPGAAVVLPYLSRRNLRNVDLLITHGHLDHYGGARALLASGRVGRLLVAATDSAETWRRDLSEIARRRGVETTFLSAGDRLDGGAWPVECLWPPERGRPIEETNSRSLVLAFGPARATLLTTGDLERDVEEAVLAAPELHGRRVLALKVAHHGGNTGTDAQWLQRLSPRWAIVSCARINRYGHPHPAVLRRLEAEGVVTRRTDRVGALRVEWDAVGGMRVRPTRGGASP